MVKIEDEKGLRGWLEAQPRGVSLGIAARAALRSVPMLEGYLGPKADREHGARAVLRLLRFILIAQVSSNQPTRAMRQTALDALGRTIPDRFMRIGPVLSLSEEPVDLAIVYATRALNEAARSARSAAHAAGSTLSVPTDGSLVFYRLSQSAALFAADAAASFASSVGYAKASSGASNANVARADAWAVTAGDVALVEASGDFAALGEAPIWREGEAPDEMAEAWEGLKHHLRDSGGDWGFWVRWYERCLAGGAQNWEVLGEVVGIEDTVWTAGVEAALARIAEIEAGDGAG